MTPNAVSSKVMMARGTENAAHISLPPSNYFTTGAAGTNGQPGTVKQESLMDQSFCRRRLGRTALAAASRSNGAPTNSPTRITQVIASAKRAA